MVRPGPIQGGAVQPLHRAPQAPARGPGLRGPYEHPLLRPVLEETLGTIVYQEQVIEVAMALAGFSSSEAEGCGGRCRRSARCRRSSPTTSTSCGGGAERGVASEIAERVWGQIQGFSGHFPGAPGGVRPLAYQSAWLRVHRGPEFLCSLLNEQPMGFYPPDSLVHEVQRRGIRVAPPHANVSRALCHVESPRAPTRSCAAASRCGSASAT